jgi:hypothetical protein
MQSKLQLLAQKQQALLLLNAGIKQMNSTYIDPVMSPTVVEPELTATGHIRKFDIGQNKFIYKNLTGTVVSNPLNPASRAYK